MGARSRISRTHARLGLRRQARQTVNSLMVEKLGKRRHRLVDTGSRIPMFELGEEERAHLWDDGIHLTPAGGGPRSRAHGPRHVTNHEAVRL